MITIRKAVPGDMKELCRMALAMHKEGSNILYANMNIRNFAETVADLSANESGAVFVAEIDGKVCGMSAVMLDNLWFNETVKIGQELFWWVDKEYRIGVHIWKALLKPVEEWAKKSGCKTYSMGNSAELPHNRLRKIYTRWGYAPKDMFYIKEL